ncbi:MAG: alpha/beta fold hydrolase, partial [Chloroflexi bacterium]|nr:alpha/beta fold hydrolase [Chloroflexota bacterium]
MTSAFGVRDIFVEANGLRQHLIARGSANAPSVVLLHNLVGQARMFDRAATELADRFQVFALDFRGRGESAWGPHDEYTQSVYVSDVEAVREALGIQRLAIVGT